jgi:hypothetical protein
LRGAIPIALFALATSSGAAIARTESGGEFDRITGDMREAAARHDVRLYHAFEDQLRRLIDRSISS